MTVSDLLGSAAHATVNVGPSIGILPQTATLVPRGTVTFVAHGGAGGFTYAIATNRSGGSIGASTGVYVAGPTANVIDIVQVTDSVGGSITAEVNVGPTVRLAPSAATLAPRRSLTFTASLGSGTGYVYALSTNLSGGTIDAHSGAYVAGPTANVTDVVEVTDSLGNSVTAQVNVGPTVVLTPPAATLAPRGAITFTASLGSGTGYLTDDVRIDGAIVARGGDGVNAGDLLTGGAGGLQAVPIAPATGGDGGAGANGTLVAQP